MDTALKAIEAAISTTKNMIEYYQKEADKAMTSKAEEEANLIKQQNDYKEIRVKLGLEKTKE